MTTEKLATTLSIRRIKRMSLPTLVGSRFIVCLFSAFIVAGCSPGTGKGTDTGNPFQPVLEGVPSVQISQALCGKILDCHPSALNCESSILQLSGLPIRFGDSLHTTLRELSDTEAQGQMPIDSTKFATCLDDIANLSCSDPLVAGSYNSGTGSYSGAIDLVPSGSASCAGVY